MASAEDNPGIDLSNVLAPFFWGFVISLFLSGITVLQAYNYFPHPDDRLFVRVTAGIMLLLDMTSSALIAQSLYYYLIPHFGSLAPLSSVTPGLSAECLISGIITFVSQMYFVYQIWTIKSLSQSTWVICGLITLFAVLTLLGGVGCVVTMYVFQHGVLSNRNSKFSMFFGIAKGFGAVTDILATAAMCTYLSTARTGIAETNGLIKSLMRFVIHRGALVTLIQTLLLITFYAAPTKIYWIAFHVNVTKLYANTFFAMLNAREHLIAKHSRKSGALSWSVHSDPVRITEEQPHTTLGTQEYEMPIVSKRVMIAEL